MKIAVFGGTGFIGKLLVSEITKKNWTPVVLDQRRNREWEKELFSCDAVINLAGTPIFQKRWNQDFMAEIHSSRVQGTKKIVEALKKNQQNGAKTLALINASAIGFYGSSRNQSFSESSGSGTEFLSMVCRDTEDEAIKAQHVLGIRTVITRFGIVLGVEGGALPKLVTPFNLFLGGPINFGKEWMSWVHVDDVVRFLIYAVENSKVEGIFNLTAPEPVTNKVFSKTLGKVLERPSWFITPSFGLRLLLGDSAQVVINGQKVLPQRTLETGFRFLYPELEDALKQILQAHYETKFVPKDEMVN